MLCWMPLNRPRRRPERLSLWLSLWLNWWRRSSQNSLWAAGGKSLEAGVSWRALAPARVWERGSPSLQPGPRYRAGRGCGARHLSLCPPPEAWCGEEPEGFCQPPAERNSVSPKCKKNIWIKNIGIWVKQCMCMTDTCSIQKNHKFPLHESCWPILSSSTSSSSGNRKSGLTGTQLFVTRHLRSLPHKLCHVCFFKLLFYPQT